MNNKGPASDLRADIESLGHDAFPEMGALPDSLANSQKGALLSVVLEAGHLGEEEENEKAKNDSSDGQIGHSDIPQIGLLKFAEFFRLGGAHRGQGIGHIAVELAKGFLMIREAVFVEGDFGAIRKSDFVVL